jgi:hypothetical protein
MTYAVVWAELSKHDVIPGEVGWDRRNDGKMPTWRRGNEKIEVQYGRDGMFHVHHVCSPDGPFGSKSYPTVDSAVTHVMECVTGPRLTESDKS